MHGWFLKLLVVRSVSRCLTHLYCIYWLLDGWQEQEILRLLLFLFLFYLSSLIPLAADVGTKALLWPIVECGTSIFSYRLKITLWDVFPHLQNFTANQVD